MGAEIKPNQLLEGNENLSSEVNEEAIKKLFQELDELSKKVGNDKQLTALIRDKDGKFDGIDTTLDQDNDGDFDNDDYDSLKEREKLKNLLLKTSTIESLYKWIKEGNENVDEKKLNRALRENLSKEIYKSKSTITNTFGKESLERPIYSNEVESIVINHRKETLGYKEGYSLFSSSFSEDKSTVIESNLKEAGEVKKNKTNIKDFESEMKINFGEINSIYVGGEKNEEIYEASMYQKDNIIKNNTSLTNENDSITRNLKASNFATNKYTKDFQDFQDRDIELSDSMNSTAAEIENTKVLAGEVNESYKRLDEDITSLVSSSKSLKNEISDAESGLAKDPNNDELKSLILSLKTHSKTVLNLIKTSRESKKIYKKQLNILNGKLDGLYEKLATDKEDAKDLEEEAKEAYENFSKKISSIRDNIEKSTSSINKLVKIQKSLLKELKKNYDKIKEGNKGLKNEEKEVLGIRRQAFKDYNECLKKCDEKTKDKLKEKFDHLIESIDSAFDGDMDVSIKDEGILWWNKNEYKVIKKSEKKFNNLLNNYKDQQSQKDFSLKLKKLSFSQDEIRNINLQLGELSGTPLRQANEKLKEYTKEMSQYKEHLRLLKITNVEYHSGYISYKNGLNNIDTLAYITKQVQQTNKELTGASYAPNGTKRGSIINYSSRVLRNVGIDNDVKAREHITKLLNNITNIESNILGNKELKEQFNKVAKQYGITNINTFIQSLSSDGNISKDDIKKVQSMHQGALYIKGLLENQENGLAQRYIDLHKGEEILKAENQEVYSRYFNRHGTPRTVGKGMGIISILNSIGQETFDDIKDQHTKYRVFDMFMKEYDKNPSLFEAYIKHSNENFGDDDTNLMSFVEKMKILSINEGDIDNWNKEIEKFAQDLTNDDLVKKSSKVENTLYTKLFGDDAESRKGEDILFKLINEAFTGKVIIKDSLLYTQILGLSSLSGDVDTLKNNLKLISSLYSRTGHIPSHADFLSYIKKTISEGEDTPELSNKEVASIINDSLNLVDAPEKIYTGGNSISGKTQKYIQGIAFILNNDNSLNSEEKGVLKFAINHNAFGDVRIINYLLENNSTKSYLLALAGKQNKDSQSWVDAINNIGINEKKGVINSFNHEKKLILGKSSIDGVTNPYTPMNFETFMESLNSGNDQYIENHKEFLASALIYIHELSPSERNKYIMNLPKYVKEYLKSNQDEDILSQLADSANLDGNNVIIAIRQELGNLETNDFISQVLDFFKEGGAKDVEAIEFIKENKLSIESIKVEIESMLEAKDISRERYDAIMYLLKNPSIEKNKSVLSHLNDNLETLKKTSDIINDVISNSGLDISNVVLIKSEISKKIDIKDPDYNGISKYLIEKLGQERAKEVGDKLVKLNLGVNNGINELISTLSNVVIDDDIKSGRSPDKRVIALGIKANEDRNNNIVKSTAFSIASRNGGVIGTKEPQEVINEAKKDPLFKKISTGANKLKSKALNAFKTLTDKSKSKSEKEKALKELEGQNKVATAENKVNILTTVTELSNQGENLSQESKDYFSKKAPEIVQGLVKQIKEHPDNSGSARASLDNLGNVLKKSPNKTQKEKDTLAIIQSYDLSSPNMPIKINMAEAKSQILESKHVSIDGVKYIGALSSKGEVSLLDKESGRIVIVQNGEKKEIIILNEKEKQQVGESTEGISNFADFRKVMVELNLEKLWKHRGEIMTEVAVNQGVSFSLGSDYLDEKEIMIYLDTILAVATNNETTIKTSSFTEYKATFKRINKAEGPDSVGGVGVDGYSLIGDKVYQMCIKGKTKFDNTKFKKAFKGDLVNKNTPITKEVETKVQEKKSPSKKKIQKKKPTTTKRKPKQYPSTDWTPEEIAAMEKLGGIIS